MFIALTILTILLIWLAGWVDDYYQELDRRDKISQSLKKYHANKDKQNESITINHWTNNLTN